MAEQSDPVTARDSCDFNKENELPDERAGFVGSGDERGKDEGMLMAKKMEDVGDAKADPFSAMLRRPSSFGDTASLSLSPSSVCTKRAKVVLAPGVSQPRAIPHTLPVPTCFGSGDVSGRERRAGERNKKRRVRFLPRSQELPFDPIEPSDTIDKGEAISIGTFQMYLSDLMQQITVLTSNMMTK